MKNIKKIIFISFLALTGCLFTSCFDYVQTYYVDSENPDTHNGIYCKFGVSKLLSSMCNMDAKSLLPSEDITKQLPEGFSITSYETDTEIGFEINGSVKYETDDKKELPWISEEKDNLVYYPFYLGRSAEEIFATMPTDDDSQAMIAMMLGDAKCRVIIEKDFFDDETDSSYSNSEKPKLYFQGLNGVNKYYLTVFDYGNEYCVEVPFLLLSEYQNYDFSYIIEE